MTLVMVMMVKMKTPALRRRRKERGECYQYAVSPTTVSHFSRFKIFNVRRHDRNYRAYLELIKLIPSMTDRVMDPHEASTLIYYAQVSQLIE